MCAGWLFVPDPGGVPPGASGAEGECKRWRDANCEGKRGGSGFGDGHRSQASAHKHTARVKIPQQLKAVSICVRKSWTPSYFILCLLFKTFGRSFGVLHIVSFVWHARWKEFVKRMLFQKKKTTQKTWHVMRQMICVSHSREPAGFCS